jgi:hypothetical protein
MGLIRSLVRANAIANEMAAERAKYREFMAAIDKATADLYAASEAGFAERAAGVNIPDATARVVREPEVVAASHDLDRLRSSIIPSDFRRVSSPYDALLGRTNSELVPAFLGT